NAKVLRLERSFLVRGVFLCSSRGGWGALGFMGWSPREHGPASQKLTRNTTPGGGPRLLYCTQPRWQMLNFLRVILATFRGSPDQAVLIPHVVAFDTQPDSFLLMTEGVVIMSYSQDPKISWEYKIIELQEA